MYVLNWEFSYKHPGISHPVVPACDQTQQMMPVVAQMGFLWLNLLQFKQTYTEHGTHCKKDMSAWKTCPCLSPSVPSKTLFLPQFAQSSALWGTTNRIDVNHVKRLKNLHIMAAATLYSGLLMGWRSRWCWQTRMQSQTRWCQWCRCRDSCRQGHPHRRLAPPSARTVPAKTASAECFLQQDLEWCPRSKASPSRQGPRARKQAHVRRSEPCCKFCHTKKLHRSGLKGAQAEAKMITESDVNTNPRATHWPPCMFWIGNSHTNIQVSHILWFPHVIKPNKWCPLLPKWDSFSWIFCSSNKHTLNMGPTARRTCQHGKHAHACPHLFPHRCSSDLNGFDAYPILIQLFDDRLWLFIASFIPN